MRKVKRRIREHLDGGIELLDLVGDRGRDSVRDMARHPAPRLDNKFWTGFMFAIAPALGLWLILIWLWWIW